jgi:hypothetical protein
VTTSLCLRLILLRAAFNIYHSVVWSNTQLQRWCIELIFVIILFNYKVVVSVALFSGNMFIYSGDKIENNCVD